MMRQISAPIDGDFSESKKQSNPTELSRKIRVSATSQLRQGAAQVGAAGQALKDGHWRIYLLIEKLGEGLQKESWYKPGPVLCAIPSDELVLLERVLGGDQVRGPTRHHRTNSGRRQMTGVRPILRQANMATRVLFLPGASRGRYELSGFARIDPPEIDPRRI
ncbi:MAG: hypothetical protein U0787_14855 [Polyangia bacterium]